MGAAPTSGLPLSQADTGQVAPGADCDRKGLVELGRIQILLDDANAFEADFLEHLPQGNEVDHSILRLSEGTHLDRLGERSLLGGNLGHDPSIHALDVQVRDPLVMIAHEAHDVTPAVGVVTGVQAHAHQGRIGDFQVSLDLLFSLYGCLRMGVKGCLESESVSHVSANPIAVVGKSAPLLLSELGGSDLLPSEQIRVHALDQHAELGAQCLQQTAGRIDLRLALVPGIGPMQVSEDEASTQSQLVGIEEGAQGFRTGRQVAVGTEFDGAIPGSLHLVQELLEGRLMRIAREPHPPGVRADTQFESHETSRHHFANSLHEGSSATTLRLMNQEGAQALKAALRRDQCLLATWLTTSDPMVTEAIALAGFDACILDAEHGPVTAGTALMTQIVADRSQLPLLVRIPAIEPAAIASALDNGAAGIIVPRVTSAEQAAEAIHLAHYPPNGSRGFGPRRASGYLRQVDEYLASAADSTIVVVQIETKGAIDDLDAILALPDLDGILVGRNDLATELRMSRDPADPALAAITRDILTRARAAGRGAGLACAATPAAAVAAASLGANFIAAGIDIEFVVRAVDGFLDHTRTLLGKTPD